MKLIDLGKITRPHGLSRGGVVVLKAELFQSGGQLFKELSKAYFAEAGSQDYREIAFQEISPSGGAWGSAKGLLLKFSEAEAPPLQSRVALPRESFPSLDHEEAEFYICDVIGLKVQDEEGRDYGIVDAFFDNKAGQVSLQARSASKSIVFPAAWIDLKESHFDGYFPLGHIIVPGLKAWLL